MYVHIYISENNKLRRVGEIKKCREERSKNIGGDGGEGSEEGEGEHGV